MERSERRLNLLTGDWILVSPQRQRRPWQGAVDARNSAPVLQRDPACHLCPGARRANGVRNLDYSGVYVFDNDFPALTKRDARAPETTPEIAEAVFVSAPEGGECRVICYAPDHGLPMSRMSQLQIEEVVRAWTAQFVELDGRPDIGAVVIFENRGEAMGASSPHPHGQIWATESVPNEIARENARQHEWLIEYKEPLLTAYLRRELAAGDRVVAVNDAFVALVPFWAAWPYETLVLPRRSLSALDALTSAECAALAEILGRLTAGYDALFGAPFPYSMGFHQRPRGGGASGHFTMHAHFYPPLREPSVRKFMVGFEMLAMAQRDLTPEDAAGRLRAAIPAAS